MSDAEDTDRAHLAAAQLTAQYGDDAEVIATLRAAEIAAMGDGAALRHWDRIIAILQSGARDDQPLN